MLDGLIVMIQLRTRTFPTLPRLTHIMSRINQQYRNLGPFCNSCVPESITHLIIECPRCVHWIQYRMQLESDIPEFFEFLKDGGYSHDQRVIFLLGGVPNDLENLPACSNGSGFRKLWNKSLPNILLSCCV